MCESLLSQRDNPAPGTKTSSFDSDEFVGGTAKDSLRILVMSNLPSIQHCRCAEPTCPGMAMKKLSPGESMKCRDVTCKILKVSLETCREVVCRTLPRVQPNPRRRKYTTRQLVEQRVGGFLMSDSGHCRIEHTKNRQKSWSQFLSFPASLMVCRLDVEWWRVLQPRMAL